MSFVDRWRHPLPDFVHPLHEKRKTFGVFPI